MAGSPQLQGGQQRPQHWKQQKPEAEETSAAVGMAATAETPASRDPLPWAKEQQ
jgi:hypothetical protein